jgi:malate dehydrogenase (oxaloacetate-decarboxylating)
LNSNLYLGLKRRRATGKEYDDYLDIFVKAVQEMFPMAMLHFEDFGLPNARRLLEKYQPKLACFNGQPSILTWVDDRWYPGNGMCHAGRPQGCHLDYKGGYQQSKDRHFWSRDSRNRYSLSMVRDTNLGIADQLRDMIALDSGKSKEEATKQI